MHNTVTQVKFTIESDIVSAFKKRCALEGVSMASVIRQYMRNGAPVKHPATKTHTRPCRRKAVDEAIALLNNILNDEYAYYDNIPDQFEQRRGAAEHTCEKLSEAIGCLGEAFDQ